MSGGSEVSEETLQRQNQLVHGLERLGGGIVAEGRYGLGTAQTMEALGLEPMHPHTYSNFMRDSERRGIIRREVQGKLTRAIYLVHPDRAEITPTIIPADAPRRVRDPDAVRLRDNRKMSARRRKLIAGLKKVGGSIENPQGLSPEYVMRTLGMSGRTTSFTGLLRAAEEAGIIRRNVNERAKKTYGIYLTDEFGGQTEAKAAPAKKQRKAAASLLGLPVPPLGSSLTVFFTSLKDGQISIGLQNETGSWSAVIEGYAESKNE